MPEDDVKPWERQTGESQEAWEAFSAYLDMGANRTLIRVSEALGKSRQLMERWSQRDRWQARILAYDRMMARAITNRVVVGTAAMRERLAQQGMNMQTQAAKAVLGMTDQEIKRLRPSEVVALARAGAVIEQQARSVSAEELMMQEREDVPRFSVRFIEGAPEEFVSVRMEDGAIGYLPQDAVEAFRKDYPTAVVVL